MKESGNEKNAAEGSVANADLLAVWEAWCVPTAINKFSKPRKIGGPYDRETAEEAIYFDRADDPAPDKGEYYRWEIRRIPANVKRR